MATAVDTVVAAVRGAEPLPGSTADPQRAARSAPSRHTRCSLAIG